MANSQNINFYKTIFGDIFDDKSLKMYATYMQVLSIRVLLFHEFGHIYNGHLQELKGKNANLSISENETADLKDGDMEIIKWQATEWDADRFCAYHMVPFQFQLQEMLFLKELKLEAIYSNKIYMLYAIILSVMVTFSILGAGREDTTGKSYKEKRHLPERFRTFCFIDDILSEYNHIFGTNEAMGNGKKREFIFAFEEWIDKYMEQVCNLPNWNTKNNNDIFDANHMKYYKKVETYKDQNLDRLLQKTNRCGLSKLQDKYINIHEFLYSFTDTLL